MAAITPTAQQLSSVVRQILAAPKFRLANPHLTDEEVADLRRYLRWPRKPVFTPYAETKSGYSQVRAKELGGIKILTHRVTYWQHFARDPAGLDVSHILYIGPKTSRNINPVHLAAESNEINQTRKACFLYFESLMQDRENIEAQGTALESRWLWWQACVREPNGLCRILHSQRTCQICWDEWLKDRREQQGLEEAPQLETEDEASQRLSQDAPALEAEQESSWEAQSNL